MLVLILGVALWSVVHLSSSVTPGLREAIRGRVGEQPYRAAYALLIVLSVILIVLGWRSSSLASAYQPPPWGYQLALALMPLALILFVSANAPGNVRRILRHPMLLGVVLWSLAHLASNGEKRSLVLFGVIGIWAVLEIIFINRREGEREKQPSVSPVPDLVAIVLGLLVFAALAWLHPYFAGKPALHL